MAQTTILFPPEFFARDGANIHSNVDLRTHRAERLLGIRIGARDFNKLVKSGDPLPKHYDGPLTSLLPSDETTRDVQSNAAPPTAEELQNEFYQWAVLRAKHYAYDLDEVKPEVVEESNTRGIRSLSASELRKKRVCIVGAGAAGLHAAMLLSYLNSDPVANGGFEWEYDIYEASNRIGGRIFTHRFSNDTSQDKEHQYYDIGAMRIPDIKGMHPTLKLIDYFNEYTEKHTGVKTTPVPLETYYMKPYDPKPPTPPTNDDAPKGVAPPQYYFRHNDPKWEKSIEAQVKAALCTYMDKFTKDDFKTGFLNVVQSPDEQLSTRQYLVNWLKKKNYEKGDMKAIFKRITEMETYVGGVGWFNQAFSETVLENYDFHMKPSKKRSKTGWVRVDGGMDRLTEAMSNHKVGGVSRDRIKLHHEVTEIAYNEKNGKMRVSFLDNTNLKASAPATTEEYDVVLNATTLGALQRMNLVNLPDTLTQHGKDQYTAIRCCQYDVSCKIAIQFTEAWWFTKASVTYPGCVSGTDMPIRSVVYPSWVTKETANQDTVLIVSYCWGQDAVRMGGMIDNNSKDKQISPALMRLVLQSLANLYNKDNITVETLSGLVKESHAYAWGNDPHAADAFAYFGPGQYSNMFPSLVTPIAGSMGNMMVIGEALSPHHAWISGALSSALVGLWTHFHTKSLEAKRVGAKVEDPALVKAYEDAAAALLKAPWVKEGDGTKNSELAAVYGLFPTWLRAAGGLAMAEYSQCGKDVEKQVAEQKRNCQSE